MSLFGPIKKGGCNDPPTTPRPDDPKGQTPTPPQVMSAEELKKWFSECLKDRFERAGIPMDHNQLVGFVVRGMEIVRNISVAAARADEREIVSDFVGRWVECRVCKKRHHIRNSHKCFYCKDFYCSEDAERHFHGHNDRERMEARGHLERVRVKAWNEALQQARRVLIKNHIDSQIVFNGNTIHGEFCLLKLPEAQPVEPTAKEGA